MVRKPINQVVAEALRFYMGDKWTDYSLGKRAGVAANTVRNYLSPEQRQPGKSGKEPSAKLTELAKLAAALDVEVADLVTDISENARRLTLRQKAAAYYADNGRLPSWAPDPEPDVENRKATVA